MSLFPRKNAEMGHPPGGRSQGPRRLIFILSRNNSGIGWQLFKENRLMWVL